MANAWAADKLLTYKKVEHAQGLGTTNLYPANSKFYQQMIDAIDSMGHGYMSPWFYALHGSLLDKNVKEVKNMVNGYHVTTYKETSYTIM